MNRVQRCYCVVWDVFVNRFIREITYIRVRVLLLKASLTKDINMQRVGRGILFIFWWIIAHTHFNMFVDEWTSANESPVPKDVHMQRVGRGILFLLVDYWLLSIPFLCSHKIITRDYFFLCKLILSFITPTSCVNVRKAYRITGGHTNTSTCIQKDPRSRSVC